MVEASAVSLLSLLTRWLMSHLPPLVQTWPGQLLPRRQWQGTTATKDVQLWTTAYRGVDE